MVYKCCVPNCRGNYKGGPKVHVFSFPKDALRNEEWIRAIRRKDFTPTIHSKVCQLHFKTEDILYEKVLDDINGEKYVLAFKNKKLRRGAVPMILPSIPKNQNSSASTSRTVRLRKQALENCLPETLVSELPLTNDITLEERESNDTTELKSVTVSSISPNSLEEPSPLLSASLTAKLQKLVSVNKLPQSLVQKIRSIYLHESKKSFTTFEEFLKCLESNKLSNEWITTVVKENSVMFLHLEMNPAPEIVASAVVNRDLELSFFVGKEEIKKLDTREFPVKITDFNELQDILDKLKVNQNSLEIVKDASLVEQSYDVGNLVPFERVDIEEVDVKAEEREGSDSESNTDPVSSTSCVKEIIQDPENEAHSCEEQFECIVCLKKFKQWDSFDRHKKTHSVERKLFECNVCEKKFKKISGFFAHIKRRDTTFECNICKKKCYSLVCLKRHLLIHDGNDKMPLQCNICMKKFRYLCDLNRHTQLVHNGEKPYQCDICMDKFTASATLKSHVQVVHGGEKPFECNVCMKKFGHKSSLRAHKLIHTGETPYECNICLKSFRKSATVKRHKLLHSGVKPYECTICSKKFVKKSALNSHMRIHGDEKIVRV